MKHAVDDMCDLRRGIEPAAIVEHIVGRAASAASGELQHQRLDLSAMPKRGGRNRRAGPQCFSSARQWLPEFGSALARTPT